jgi:hypothetical protein
LLHCVQPRNHALSWGFNLRRSISRMASTSSHGLVRIATTARIMPHTSVISAFDIDDLFIACVK